MATYYKRIKGKNYDGKLINKADRSVKGRGDGRISLSDAKTLLKTVKDSNNYSEIEKATMRHIRDNYDFTPEADRWFRSQIRSWAAVKSSPGPAARKKAAVKKAPAKKQPRRKQPMEQEYIAPPSELIEREPISSGRTRSKVPAIIILVLIAVILGLFLYPKSKQWIKSRMGTSIQTAETTVEKPAPQPAAPEAVQAEKKAEPAAQVKPVPPPAEEGSFYVVQVHEGLINIAENELGDYKKWVDIYRANIKTIPPTLMLYPGQKLKMPEGWKAKK